MRYRAERDHRTTRGLGGLRGEQHQRDLRWPSERNVDRGGGWRHITLPLHVEQWVHGVVHHSWRWHLHRYRYRCQQLRTGGGFGHHSCDRPAQHGRCGSGSDRMHERLPHRCARNGYECHRRAVERWGWIHPWYRFEHSILSYHGRGARRWCRTDLDNERQPELPTCHGCRTHRALQQLPQRRAEHHQRLVQWERQRHHRICTGNTGLQLPVE